MKGGEEVYGEEMKKAVENAWTKLGMEDIEDSKFDIEFAQRVKNSVKRMRWCKES